MVLAYLLFICIESLRGEVETAIKHCNSGMSILISRLKVSKSQAGERLKADLLPVLCRAELLSVLFGNTPTWKYAIEPGDILPDRFSSFREARDSIFHLMSLSVRLLRNIRLRRLERRLEPQDYAMQAEIQQRINAWHRLFLNMLLHRKWTHQEAQASRILRIHHLVTSIMIVRSTGLEESAADALLPQFEAATVLAEEIIESEAGQSTHSPAFLLDMELVSPL